MLKGLERKPYDGWIRPLALFSLEKMKLRVDLIAVYSIFTSGSRVSGTDLFSVVASDRAMP